MSTLAFRFVRLLSKAQVITEYGITPDIEAGFFRDCPVAWWQSGEPVFKESDVDEYMKWFRSPPYVFPARRRGGRLCALEEVAKLAATLRDEGKSWKEVTSAVNAHLDLQGREKKKPEAVRKLVERHRSRIREIADGRTRSGGVHAAKKVPMSHAEGDPRLLKLIRDEGSK